MKTKTKTLLLSALLGSSLLLSTVPASAHDDYRYRRERWDNRYDGDRGGTYRELQAARERLNYDTSHHKSRKQIAKDEERIHDLESQLRGGGGWNWRRGWWN